jgi:hypothetical protein
MTKLRPFLRAAFLVVLPTLLACLALLEIGLRLQGRLPSNVTDGIFEAHGDGYRLRPNQTKLSRTPSFVCTIHTDALGFRDRAPGPRQLDRPYLAWMGDSATFANGVEYEESFVGRFGLAAGPRGLDVLNLAVGGHHLAEQEEQLADFLKSAPRPPEQVLVVLTPQLMALFEERHHDLVFKNGYGFPKDHWVVPYLVVMAGNASSAYSFFRDGIRHVQGKLWHRGPETAALMLEMYARTYPAASPEATARFEARLTRLDERIRAAGSTPVHVYLPTTADLRLGEFLKATGRGADAYDFDHYRAARRRQAAAAGVRLVDLQEVLAAEQAKGKPLGFSQDMHYNAPAHAVIARALVEELLGPEGAGPGTSRR